MTNEQYIDFLAETFGVPKEYQAAYKQGAEQMGLWKDNMLEKFLREYAMKLGTSNPDAVFSEIYNSWVTFQDNYPNNK